MSIERTMYCDVCERDEFCDGKKLPHGWTNFMMTTDWNGDGISYHVCDKCMPPKSAQGFQKLFKWWFSETYWRPHARTAEMILQHLGNHLPK